MSITQTVVPEWADKFTSLIFYVPADEPVRQLRTGDWNLVPTAPLMVEPFDEGTQTLDAAPWHGTIEYTPLQDRVFGNSEGSWEFYYVPDGERHSFWDCYSSVKDLHRSSGRWLNTDGTWLSTYHALLYFLQGQRVAVDVPDGEGNLTRYTGRCWVSSCTTDQDGQMRVTISYSLAPPEKYGQE